MIRNTFTNFGILGALLLSASCVVQQPSSALRAQEFQPQIDMPTSIVVCRSKQCAPAKLSMSKEYIYNSLTSMLEHNAHEKALICQADPFTHTCTEDYLTLPITVGVTPANMYINDVEIEDVSIALNRQSIDLQLNYGVSYNGQTPVCKPAKSLIYVKNSQNIILEDAGYMCKMTTIGNTTIKSLLAIDYIDLDYGFIGGYYSIGLSGPAYGGRSGYMLIKLKNDAYPLSADLILKEPQTEQQIHEGVPVDSGVYEYAPCSMPTCQGAYYPQGYEQPYMVESQGAAIPQPIAQKRNTQSATENNESNENSEGTEYDGVEVFPIYQKKKN